LVLIAKSASEIEGRFPAGQLQPGENNGLTGNDIRQSVSLVQKSLEEVRLRGAIDCGKEGNPKNGSWPFGFFRESRIMGA